MPSNKEQLSMTRRLKYESRAQSFSNDQLLKIRKLVHANNISLVTENGENDDERKESPVTSLLRLLFIFD